MSLLLLPEQLSTTTRCHLITQFGKPASKPVSKPDPEIYKLACRELGAEPSDAVYLDDLGINYKPARAGDDRHQGC